MTTVDAATTPPGAPATRARSPWRAVAVPSEHGGWGLTLEPVLLGLLIAPSWAGASLGTAAFVAFLARTPLKLALVDRARGRWLDRSSLAVRVLAGELLVLAALAAVAVARSGPGPFVAVAVAAPLVAIELWFDMRSRGRRLVPELCGAIGISASVAAIVVAGGHGARLATAAWLVLAARAVGALPFVRAQILRLRRGTTARRPVVAAQAAAVAGAAGATVADTHVATGLVGVVALAALQLTWLRRPPVAAKVLGLRQMALGLGLVAVTAAGVLTTR